MATSQCHSIGSGLTSIGVPLLPVKGVTAPMLFVTGMAGTSTAESLSATRNEVFVIHGRPNDIDDENSVSLVLKHTTVPLADILAAQHGICYAVPKHMLALPIKGACISWYLQCTLLVVSFQVA